MQIVCHLKQIQELFLNMIEQILKNIELIRVARGFSQEGMAAEMNKTQSAYARFESGKTKIDLKTLEEFATANNMSIIDVITYPKKYVDKDEIANIDNIETSIQIKLSPSQKEKVLRILFGEKAKYLK